MSRRKKKLSSSYLRNISLYKILGKIYPHILPISIIVGLAYYVWRGILSQTFMGEAFLYFRYGFFHQNMAVRQFLIDNDKGARMYFDIVKPFFQDNIFLYQALMLFISLVIFILFYFMTFSFIKSRVAAFASSVFFSVNFASLYEFIAWRYDVFVERMINALLLFPSFMFFVLFVQKNKKLFYILSVILYIFSVYTAHFSIFYLPLLFFYFLFFVFLRENSFREKVLSFLLFLPYVISSAIFLLIDKYYGFSHLGRDSFPLTIEIIPEIGFQILHQISRMTIPPFLFESSINYYLLVLIGYIGIIIYIYFKKNKKVGKLLFAIFLATITVCFLNLFMRWSQVINLNVPYRYFFTPSIPLSLFWGISLYIIFFKQNKIGKIIFLIVILFWTIMNNNLISERIKRDSKEHIASKKIMSYVKNTSSKFSNDSIIIVPDISGNHGANFMQIYYGKKNTYFTPLFGIKQYSLPREFDPKKDYLLDYDYQMSEIVDKTLDYQEIFKEIKKTK